MSLAAQITWLFVLSVPVACVSWTVTHEEIFRELREYCSDRSHKCPGLLRRKFYYLFTCEYCFSHYVTIFFLIFTRYRLLLEDWRGYVISFFERKFFYLFTCEYCFSHYVTIFFLIFTRYKLLLDDWRGYVIAFFALVFVTNAYLNLYSRLRVDITQAKVETKKIEKEVNSANPNDETGMTNQ
jgi:hypothetical protein